MTLLPNAPSSKANHEPLYNIGVVTRMTGISMATLRAWERRYNFPEASRTSGGHRLYSERDILRLRWVKARIEEGMQTAQAIQALRHQEELGLNLSQAALSPIAPETKPQAGFIPLQLYQDRLFQALIQRDLQQADLILSELLAITTVENLILQCIGPVLARIGDAWDNHELSIANEHLATNYLRHRLLMWMVSGPPAMPVRPIVLACAPNEWHEGSLLMLGALLRRQSMPVAYLGQSVPLQDLASFVQDIRPAAVVLVAMTESSATALIEWPQWMPEAAKTGVPAITFGGRIFSIQPEWQRKVPGIFLGNTIQEGLEKLIKIAKGPPSLV